MSRPDICVTIPTYNRGEILLDTIAAVLSQSHTNLELLVVDQSFDHDQKIKSELASIKDKRFRYYLVGPPSLPAARNFALQKATAPIVLFIDDDIIPSKDLVAHHVQAFKDHPDVSAVAGRVTQEGFKKLPPLTFDQYGISHGGYTGLKEGYTNAFPGGNCALVVKDALRAGGFDTRYRGNAFREENDLSMRMARLGQKIYYQPKASLLHLAAAHGGLRVKTHIYDNPGFYANELFFTLRVVAPRHLPRALVRKYREYCRVVQGWHSLKRTLLFALGLKRACLRIIFGRSITAKERHQQ